MVQRSEACLNVWRATHEEHARRPEHDCNAHQHGGSLCGSRPECLEGRQGYHVYTYSGGKDHYVYNLNGWYDPARLPYRLSPGEDMGSVGVRKAHFGRYQDGERLGQWCHPSGLGVGSD